jgi:predicted nucleic acid-binding protein
VIVVDASAFVAVTTITNQRSAVLREHLGRNPHWVVPEHFTVEVAHALRGMFLRRDIDEDGMNRALQRLADAAFDIWPTKPLLPRMRQLLSNASAYDAAYIALAEELGAPLVTIDAKLVTVPGARCRFVGLE